MSVKQSSIVVTEPEKLRRASQRLKDAEIFNRDFKEISNHTSKDDFIYFDPPYTVSHNNNGFIEYNASIFSWDDQKSLRDILKELSSGGCKIMISNADHREIWKLYEDFNIISIERSSTIASNKSKRKRVTELLIKNY